MDHPQPTRHKAMDKHVFWSEVSEKPRVGTACPQLCQGNLSLFRLALLLTAPLSPPSWLLGTASTHAHNKMALTKSWGVGV